MVNSVDVMSDAGTATEILTLYLSGSCVFNSVDVMSDAHTATEMLYICQASMCLTLLTSCPLQLVPHGESQPILPRSVFLNNVTISFSPSVCDLLVILGSAVAFGQHVSSIHKVTRSPEFRRISSTRRLCQSADAIRILVSWFALSRMDYIIPPFSRDFQSVS